MKPLKLVGLALTAAALAWSGVASAHGGARIHFGFGFGGPVYWGGPAYWGPAYYPYPYYYPPAVVAPAPQQYIERSDEADAAQNYWYYCADSKAYYPYVKQCPGGWQRVAPRPQG